MQFPFVHLNMPDVIGEAQAHPAFRLKYKGVMDYDAMSTFVIKWLKDRHFEINEGVHKHKHSCPHGFEIQHGAVL